MENMEKTVSELKDKHKKEIEKLKKENEQQFYF
jgi:hypothetical protein